MKLEKQLVIQYSHFLLNLIFACKARNLHRERSPVNVYTNIFKAQDRRFIIKQNLLNPL